MGNLAFPFRLKEDGSAVVADHNQSIRDSVWIILNTRVGERVMEKDFGMNITPYLFEPANETTTQGICTAAINALYRFEPRITDIQANVAMRDGAIVVNVTYRVLQNSAADSVTATYAGGEARL
jgi:phage baseplate assembly protein W